MVGNFIGFSEEWHRESKKLLSLELVSLSITTIINKGAIAVIDRPLQAIFWRQRKFLSK
jgi:hypothetical protein